MSALPQIFIGSSQEAYDKGFAKKLFDQLKKWARPQIWKGIFFYGETPIESLEKRLSDFDAYVIILTPDDTYTTRDQTYISALLGGNPFPPFLQASRPVLGPGVHRAGDRPARRIRFSILHSSFTILHLAPRRHRSWLGSIRLFPLRSERDL
jgi:hypothetical protein